MEKSYEALRDLSLFQGMDKEGWEHLMHCLDAHICNYDAEIFIIHAGEPFKNIGIVLKGSIIVQKEDIKGNKLILDVIGPKDMFGEAIVCAQIKSSPISVLAKEPTCILFINYDKMLYMCTNTCEFHQKLIKNMLKIIACKNIFLNKRMDYMTMKGLREKISAFLSEQKKVKQSNPFDIGMTRVDMAHYLNADRSAMCRELGKMKQEGIIDYYKSSFKFLDQL